MSLIEDLKLALTGDAQALEKIEREIEYDKLSPEEIKYIQQLVTESNPHALCLAGLVYYQQKNYEKASALFEQLVELGNTNAMGYPGLMYLNGEGKAVDYFKASALFDNAIERGDAKAMFYRASMHDKGQGEAVDYSKAIELYEKAIALGNAAAMNNRADMHSKGHGGPRDYVKAITLFEKSIELGNRAAMNNRAGLHYYGEGGPVDYAKAIILFNKAIKQGNARAMCARAFMHREGQGGPRDYAKAIALLDQAMALGEAQAMYYRASMHKQGEGGRVDNDVAAYLYRKAYLQNDEIKQDAKTNLRTVASKTPRAQYHWAMVAGEPEIIKLMRQDPQTFLRFLAVDDLLSDNLKYTYVKQLLKKYPHLKTKITDLGSIAFLEKYVTAQVSADENTQISSLMSLDASIWQYLVSYLPRADKASLRLVCQFFLKQVFSNPLVWQQWVEIDHVEMFQQRGKRFGWGTRPIHGIFYSSYPVLNDSSSTFHYTALDLSQFELLFKGSSERYYMTNFASMICKGLTYLKLQYEVYLTESAILFLMQNYPDLYIDFAGNNLLFWACYRGWQNVVTRLLEQITSHRGPFARLNPLPQSGRGNNSRSPLMIAKQQGHIEIVKLLEQHITNQNKNNHGNNKDETLLISQNYTTALQPPRQSAENNLSPTTEKTFLDTKKWVYVTVQQIMRDHNQARNMAYQVILWLEYLALSDFKFSLKFGTHYIQLFAILLIDVYLDSSPEFRKLCPTQNLLDIALKEFSNQEITLLKNELHALQLQNVVTVKPISKILEKILLLLPQTKPIINRVWKILDAYNLEFYSISAHKEKICAAAIAVARLWILNKLEEAWPKDYVDKTKLNLDSFKEEYDLLSKIASTSLQTKKNGVQNQGSFFAPLNDKVNAPSSRKGLLEKLKRLKVLPLDNTWDFANSVDNTDCFYDAIAQALSVSQINTNHSIKSLRMLCSNYLQELEKTSPQFNWVNAIIAKEGGKDTYQDYFNYIQYTQEQIETLQKEGKTSKDSSIPAKFYIEGIILAIKLNIKFHLIAFFEAKPPTHVLISKEGGGEQEATDIDYHDKQIIHLALQENHFVPILPTQAQSECLQVAKQHNIIIQENTMTKGGAFHYV